ncbi:Cof-type HAD-IIB family hydrolase [Sphingomonas sp. MMS24-J13]|uniref:Cof-type HAD-IIB family hydrolase n=1 Tax=Sphingomonas sp. MMS24-J13 TaxID=3238686 RepID=UPI0038515E87
MNLRLVISDIDGTLVNKAKQLTPGTIAAVGRLRATGMPFTLISARPPSGLYPLAEALGLTEPMAAFNGGLLFKTDGTITERHLVPEDVVSGMFDLVAGADAVPWIFADGVWHAAVLEGLHVDHERIASAQEPIHTTDMSPLYARVDKLTFVSDDEPMLRDLTARAQAKFGMQATINQSQTYYLDVTHIRANKGDGIASLAAAQDVALENVAVLGDMPNDLPMFARAGIAIAMGQAPAEVRSQARYTTTSNDEDGVAHAIDTILLPMMGKDA